MANVAAKNHHSGLAPAIVGGTTGVVASAIAAISKWNDVRTTKKALYKLNERELEDIGLCRADIDGLF